MPGPYSAREAFRQLKIVSQSKIYKTHAKAKQRGMKLGIGVGAAAIGAAAGVGIGAAAAAAGAGAAGVAAARMIPVGPTTGETLKALAEHFGYKLPESAEKVVSDYFGYKVPADGEVKQKLDRTKIKSVTRGIPLTSIAGTSRSGMQGSISPERLLESMVRHQRVANELWEKEPFSCGEHIVATSCQEAEDLYKKYVEVDYHISKAKFFAEALLYIAQNYIQHCDAFGAILRKDWDEMESQVNLVMMSNEQWHEMNCSLENYCYRTIRLHKVVKAPPPPSAPPPVHGQGQAPPANAAAPQRQPPPARFWDPNRKR